MSQSTRRGRPTIVQAVLEESSQQMLITCSVARRRQLLNPRLQQNKTPYIILSPVTKPDEKHAGTQVDKLHTIAWVLSY